MFIFIRPYQSLNSFVIHIFIFSNINFKQQAALKKTEKERKAAEVATQNLEKKVRELEALFAEAEQKLKELREAGGSSQGDC